MYQLYYYPFNASMAPQYILEHVGAEYELVLVDRKQEAQKSKEFLAINPAGRIPAFKHDNLVMFESPAICLYLAEQHPQAALIPELGTPERARFHQWLMYLTNTLQAELMVYFYPFKHTSVVEQAANIKSKQEERIEGIFELLDHTLETQAFLTGEQLTVCDYYLFMLVVWADELKKPPLSFPNLSRYLSKLADNQAIKTVSKKEGLDLNPYIQNS